MTYAPLWPGWAEATRDAITQVNHDLDDETRDAIRNLANNIGDQLRSEFPDVDHGIVGWVTMRAASHLGALAAHRPNVGPRSLAFVALLAGEYIEAGDV